jgi:cellobiose-specific phosphotransferase system component IIA
VHQQLFENIVNALSQVHEKELNRLDIELNQLKTVLDKAHNEI